MLIIEIDL